jgi:hypothetical protein
VAAVIGPGSTVVEHPARGSLAGLRAA